ncbi:MAG: glycosyltransferase [Treponemataceae bacterium]
MNFNHYQIKISIIIPIYNAQKYLVECLNSCVNQKYDNFLIYAQVR